MNAPTAPDGQLLTPREAAARLRVSADCMCRWRARGVGPSFIRVGPGRGVVRYSPAALAAYLRAQEQLTGGAA